MDKGEFYRLAASYLGESECKTGTPVYSAMDSLAQHVIGLALDYTTWSFCTARITLPLDTDHAADLPADLLEIRTCSLPSFELIGKRLYSKDADTTITTVTITYKSSAHADTVCLPDAAPLFTEGCALLLAAKAAPRLTNRYDLAQDLERRAYDSLYRAKLKETRSTNSNDQRPVTIY